MARYRRPEVVVIDLQVSSPTGVEIARLIREACPNAKTVLISMLLDQEYVEEAMRAGASGIVSSDAAQSGLVPAIRSAFAGNDFLVSAWVSFYRPATKRTRETF